MNENPWEENNKLKVQYIGQSGYTQPCLLAIDAILNSGSLPEKATLVSWASDRRSQMEEHLFLFWNWGYSPLTIVPSGFSSGYSGEGPRGFSLAICMIRSKGIPLDGVYVGESKFRTIDRGQIDDVNAPIYQNIKTQSELLTWPWPLWVMDEDEELLERGQLWKKLYWREPRTDWITEAVTNIDIHYPTVGRKLRLALNKLRLEEVEEWQSAGILIRDAWIEFAQKLCEAKHIDTSGIEKDKARDMLKKLEIDERLFNLARAGFNLSFKTHHDRNIAKHIAMACAISTIMSMQTVIEEMAS